MLRKIHDYNRTAENGTLTCTLDRCPRCGKKHPWFSRHDARKRTFRLLVDGVVQKILSLLVRWKCACCGRTFTLYPDFAIPYKQYVTDTILETSAQYVENDAASYRSCVRKGTLTLGYNWSTSGRRDERTLNHATVYRWISTLASLPATLRRASQLIKQKAPTAATARAALPVPPKKHRSQARRKQLVACRRLLYTDRMYRALFQVSVFPHLATVCAWC